MSRREWAVPCVANGFRRRPWTRECYIPTGEVRELRQLLTRRRGASRGPVTNVGPHGPMPPPLMIFFGACNLIVLGLALSRFGGRLARHLPLAALIGVQAFRLPLELVLHAWYEQGVLPVQMTYSGHNFDIVSGIGGLALGVGLGLLLTVMTIAVTSSPIPLRLYSNEPVLALANYVPYVWILPVCVCGALFAHVLTFRHLLNEPTRG